jgi:predicted DNA-binding WGR domain protein
MILHRRRAKSANNQMEVKTVCRIHLLCIGPFIRSVSEGPMKSNSRKSPYAEIHLHSKECMSTIVNQERKVSQMNATITAPNTQRITLYYREGSSDKVYQASIEPAGDLFVVNFAFGRRGSTLNTGTKNTSPVDYDTAKRIYDKLIQEKLVKGYTVGADRTPYQHTDREQRVMAWPVSLVSTFSTKRSLT